MFTNLTSNISNCLQQTAHGLRLPRLLSFGSRSVLDHFSLVPRSSLVRLSFVIR